MPRCTNTKTAIWFQLKIYDAACTCRRCQADCNKLTSLPYSRNVRLALPPHP